jgi:hypothetical protein
VGVRTIHEWKDWESVKPYIYDALEKFNEGEWRIVYNAVPTGIIRSMDDEYEHSEILRTAASI